MKVKYLITATLIFWSVCVYSQAPQMFDKVKLTIENAPVNTGKSDFAAAIDDDRLIYNTVVKVDTKKKNAPNQFYDLFAEAIQAGGSLNEKSEKVPLMQTSVHEGPLCICHKTGEIFLCQSNEDETEVQNIVFKKESIRLGIFLYKKEGDKLVKTGNFPFNDKMYSVAHPAVSPEGDTLIFVSDKPGGTGGTDLYYSIRSGGQWAEPVNMGTAINTPGMEMFPVWQPDGTLFFASDGHGGKGGLDIFYTRFDGGKLGSIQTFANEINSAADDFGFIPGTDERYAYFSSNREEGKGEDDIYIVLPDEYLIDVLVLSSFTEKPVPEANVAVGSLDGKPVFESVTNTEGKLQMKLPMNKRYNMLATKSGYYDKSQELNLTSTGEFALKEQIVYLDPSHRLVGQVVNILGDEPIEGANIVIARDGVNVDHAVTGPDGYFKADIMPERKYLVTAEADGFFGTDVEFSTAGMEPGELFYYFQLYPLDAGTRIGLRNIYYDYDKYNIREDAARDLDRLAETMKKYPDIEIKLESHTDCRGTDEYNQRLSERRAKAALDYLVRKGIDKSRMSSVGFGESQLVNECADEVECSEEKHQENRRTVFEITKSKVTRKSTATEK